MGFQLLVDFDVVEYLISLPRRDRVALRNNFKIRDFRGNFADYEEHDSIGRRVQINVCGRYAIKYWTDHADQQVKILDVHPSDR